MRNENVLWLAKAIMCLVNHKEASLGSKGAQVLLHLDEHFAFSYPAKANAGTIAKETGVNHVVVRSILKALEKCKLLDVEGGGKGRRSWDQKIRLRLDRNENSCALDAEKMRWFVDAYMDLVKKGEAGTRRAHVLFELAKHADEEGVVSVSMAAIAREFGVNRVTVFRIIKKLEELGIVKRENGKIVLVGLGKE